MAVINPQNFNSYRDILRNPSRHTSGNHRMALIDMADDIDRGYAEANPDIYLPLMELQAQRMEKMYRDYLSDSANRPKLDRLEAAFRRHPDLQAPGTEFTQGNREPRRKHFRTHEAHLGDVDFYSELLREHDAVGLARASPQEVAETVGTIATLSYPLQLIAQPGQLNRNRRDENEKHAYYNQAFKEYYDRHGEKWKARRRAMAIKDMKQTGAERQRQRTGLPTGEDRARRLPEELMKDVVDFIGKGGMQFLPTHI